MELENLKENFDGLPKEQAKAILNIIEYKTNSDMKEVIAKLDVVNSKIESVDTSVRNEIKTVYWVVGLAFTIIAVLIAVLVLALKK